MKNRLLALLLAGLLTASLASCVASGNQDGNGGTENQQQLTTAPDDENTGGNPSTTEWKDVNKKVYTFKKVTMRSTPSTSGVSVASIEAGVELKCTKTSTAWSFVEYNGKQGYVSNASITDVNILGTDFETITEKVMYVNEEKINVRLYPSDAAFSTKIDSYELNDEVTVIASNGTWYKIKYDDNGTVKNYYISASLLSDTKVIDPNDMSQYEGLFTDLDTPATMYTTGNVYFRKAPSKKASPVFSEASKQTLVKGTKVTVLATGTVNGEKWSKVKVEFLPEKDGDPVIYKDGYVSSDYLSDTTGSEALTLNELLQMYPTFEAVNQTMYLLAENSINVRSTPKFSENEDSNIITVLSSGKDLEDIQQIKVVASGVYQDVNCCIIEFTKNENTVYGFITQKHLTSNSDGSISVSVNDFVLEYPNFTICQTETSITATKKANCYSTPEIAATAAKVLAAGDTVTLVAEETKSSQNVWYLIKDAENNYYFVGMEFFAQGS